MGSGDGSGFAGFLDRYLKHDYEQIVINISLLVVVGAIALSIILSIMFPPRSELTAANDDE